MCVFALAVLFGLWHLQYAWLYAGMAIFFGLLLGYAYLFTQNIYYPLGMHFGWNLSEYVVYSPYVSRIHVYHAWLAGARNITPGQEGFLSLVAIVLGWLFLWARHHKTSV